MGLFKQKGALTTETIVKLILALGFLVTGILIAILLRGRSKSVSQQIQDVFSFGFLK